MSATNRNLDYPRWQANNRWGSIDAHSQNGTVTMLQSLLSIKAANTSVMHNSNQITVLLPYLQDQKSLTLHWQSFKCIVNSTSAAIDNCFHNNLTLLAIFLTDWTQRCGKAECSNMLGLFALIPWKFIYLAKRFIEPAIHLFINRYSPATAHHLPIIYL